MVYSVAHSCSIILFFFVADTFMNPVYNIVHEKVALVSYQRDVFDENVEFVVKKLNSTCFSLSIKFTMATDIMDQKIMLKITIDKLSGSEYKRTGTSVSGNVCKNWEKNVFGIKDMISRYGNIDVCELKKGTTYYLDNFVPDVSSFPKILPFGSYRLILDFYYANSTQTLPLCLVHYYARVEKVLKY